MKALATFKMTDRLGTGVKPALTYLEKVLQALEFVDFSDIPIASFLDQNLIMDDYGNCTITVNNLEQEVEIKGTGPQSVYLRNYNGVLQYSNNHTTWFPVGSGGVGGGDMYKATYDPTETGRVLAADALSDGTNNATAAQVAAHLAAPHYAQPSTIPLPGQTTDPTAPTGNDLVLYAKQYQSGMMYSGKPVIMDRDGNIWQLITGGTDGKLLLDVLPDDVMLKAAYDAAASAPTGVVKVAQDIKDANNQTATGEQIIRHLEGDLSLYDIGSGVTPVLGMAVKVQAAEPATAVANAAIIYCYASGDPLVYELRVLFPDSTRRRIVTEAIL